MRLRSFSLNSLFLLIIIVMFFIGIFSLFSNMDSLQIDKDALKEKPHISDTNKDNNSITEREQDAQNGFIRGKIEGESQTELTAANKDKEKFIAIQPTNSDHINSLERPLESTLATQVSVDLDQKEKPASFNEFPDGFYYSVHFGSFKTLSEAEERIELLSTKGHAWWEKINIEGKGEWFRVYIGKYKTEDEALAFGNTLNFNGIDDKICIHKLKSID